MKKTIWTFGLIAGAINMINLVTFAIIGVDHIDFDKGEVIGYTAMLLSFSMIFVAIKQSRDKYNDGTITFGKAFKIGLFISLIASSIYVVVWLFEYYFIMPDFADQYGKHMVEKMRAGGASEAAVAAKMTEMKDFKELYNNPFVNIILTYTEILPIGLLVSLISAAILKKKPAIA